MNPGPPRSPRRTRLATSLIALASALLVGCNDGPPITGEIPVWPLKGRVTLKGKPLADVLLAFEPVTPATKDGKEAPRPTAQCDAEGNFQVHTYLGGDGAPAGEYRVYVTPSPSRGAERNIMAKASKESMKAPAVPARYLNAKDSGLKATVLPGENPPLNLDLN